MLPLMVQKYFTLLEKFMMHQLISRPLWKLHPVIAYVLLEFRLQGTQIDVENNTSQRHIVIKQEKRG